jgi:hypothetical protein
MAGPAVLGGVGAIDADALMILTHQCGDAIRRRGAEADRVGAKMLYLQLTLRKT